MQTELTIAARDGVVLGMTLFEPVGSPGGTVLIASAMGVPRRFYRGFAAHLADQGQVVLTVDYRGVGTSEAGSASSLADWGDLDLAAAADLLRERFPDLPLRFVGHSVGGQLLGLMGGDHIDRALLVASQSGYWRHWTGAWRLRMLALWYGLIPTLVPMLGRLPARVLGGGDDVPGGVATQWARWGRDQDYIMGFARTRTTSGFDRLSAPVRALVFSDDQMAPEDAVTALARGFRNTEAEVVQIAPSDVGLDSIGHFGAFRSHAKAGLWPEMTGWLLAT